MATPTFFAGACVVLAAALAYGTTQTHLAFRGLGPICTATSCSAAGQGTAGVPDRASARPQNSGGRRTAARGRARRPAPVRAGAAPRSRAAPRGHAASRSQAAPRASASPRTRSRAGHPLAPAAPRWPVIIAYRTVRAWPGGFLGRMTITNRSASAIPDWLLRVHYRRARVDHVWGARWYPASPHVPGAGLVAPRRGRFTLRPGASTRFTFRVSGHPGPPGGCFFDTARCHFRHPGGRAVTRRH